MNLPQPDYQYLNFDLVHDPTYGSKESPAVLTVNRSVAMIDKMEQYKCTVQRLVFPSLSIPMFAASLVKGSDYNENKMVNTFGIAVTTNGTRVYSNPVNVVWEATVLQPRPEGIVQKSLQSEYPYYYAYDIQAVLDLFNNAIIAAMADFQANHPGVLPPGQQVPFIYSDIDGPYILFPEPSVDSINYIQQATEYVELFMNNQTATLFNGFPLTQRPYTEPYTDDVTPLPVGFDAAFRATDTSTYNYSNNGTDFYRMDPLGYSMSFWSPANKFLITTTIPVEFEVISGYNPQFGGITPDTIGNSGNQNPSSSILTDFAFENGDFQSYGTQYVYNKTDSSRYTDVTGYGPLSNFTLSLYWVAKDGTQVALKLFPLTIASVKILFVKK